MRSPYSERQDKERQDKEMRSPERQDKERQDEEMRSPERQDKEWQDEEMRSPERQDKEWYIPAQSAEWGLVTANFEAQLRPRSPRCSEGT